MKLTFTSDSVLELPIHYNEQLTGFFYSNIQDETYRRFLHDEGYAYQSNRLYKHFAYSRLLGSFKLDPANKRILFHPPVSLVVASPINRILHELARSMLNKPLLRLGSNQIHLESFEILPCQPLQNRLHIKMLSPLVVYSTLTHPDGLKHTYYYRPHHERFSPMVEANLKRKYLSLNPGDEDILSAPFTILPLKVHPKQKVINRFRETIIEGWMGEYELHGDTRLLEFAYHSNLGSKGAQGFGLFEIVEARGDHA